MAGLMVVLFYIVGIYFLVQFARQENVEGDFEDILDDVEGRLEWGHSRSQHPFGMRAQLQVAGKGLRQARELWLEKKWMDAYLRAKKAEEAMDQAQRIYCLHYR